MLIFSRALPIFVFIFFSIANLFAQSIQYQGVIIDEHKAPLIGAVVSAGGGVGTLSKTDGTFSLKLDLPAHIRFSYLGYITKEIDVLKNPGRADTIIMAEEDNGMNPVVVTASKRGQNINEVSQTMEVINPGFLLKTQTIQVQKALEKVPGIVVQKDQVSIRGASGFSYGAGSRVMVLVDEMPMLSADASDPKWNYYPVENISQVEVLKGAASALYGSAAMEGIIHLRTALAADTSYTSVKVYGGFYDHPIKKDTGFWAKQKTPLMLSGITVAHRQTFGPIKLTASATFNNDDGYRKSENSYISRANIFLQYAPTDNNRLVLTFSANGMEDNGELFLFCPSVSEPYIPFAGTGSIYSNFRWHADFTARYYATETSKHIYRTRYFTTINQNNTNQSATGHVWYNEYQYLKQLWKKENYETNLTAGLNYTLTQTLSGALYGNHKGDNAAAYIQIDQKVGKFSFNVGGRYEFDKLDTFKWEYAPVFRTGITYQAGKGTFFRGSFGEGFRYPSVAEKYANTSAGLLKIIPNPDLHSEKGWSTEIGVRQLFTAGNFRGFVDASGFLSEYKDMIEYIFGYYTRPGLPSAIGFKAKNVENALIKGYEISAGMEKDFGKVHADLSGGYTFVLPYNVDSVGKTLKYGYHQYLSFRHREMVKANLNVEYSKFSFGVYAFYNSPYLNLDQFFIELVKGLKDNNYWMPYSAGLVADVRVSYKIKNNINLSLFAKNITNLEYMEVPGNTNAPRTFQAQILWEF
jgi:outer membrane receptor protein involved in Fe transport